MKEDKITAIWEEDGDLMRLKDFFAYVYQDNNLKDRIKNKTLERIAVSDAGIGSGSEGVEAPCEQNPMTAPKKKKFALLAGLGKQLQNKKNALKVVSAAAAVVLAVYVGSTGLQTTGNSSLNLGFGSAKNAATEGAALFDNGVGQQAPGENQDAMLSTSPTKGKMNTADSASSPKERSASQDENLKAAESIQQKIIYVLEATIKTDDVSAAVKAVEGKATSLGGYIAESRENNDQQQTSAFLSLRIPVKEFDSFKVDLSQFGTVSNQNLFTDDVSRQYFDVETRLRSWEAQEKRYLEILTQAKTVEDILKIEDSLANVRREMESLKGQLKYWDNRVQYSEIRLNIYPNQSNFNVTDPWQPVSWQSTLNAAKNAIIKSVSFLWNSLNYLVVFIGYAIPIGLILAAIWFIYRRYKKRSK